jgi:hypothetical protein
MKRALCIILCLFLASCAPAVAPTPTPSPTATTTPTNTPTATPTSTPTPIPLYQVIFQAFHDYNGNGQQDSEEPLLSGITISTAAKSCATGNDGTCSIYLPKGIYRLAIQDPNGKFRYILPSVREVRKISDGITGIRVNGETEVPVPLGEGFLTLPFKGNFKIDRMYDHQPGKGILWWNGPHQCEPDDNICYAVPPGTNEHWGIDYRMPEGTPVLAAAPGIVYHIEEGIVVIYHDIDVQGRSLFTCYAHLSDVNIKDRHISRGDEIGKSGMTRTVYPHLHFELLSAPKDTRYWAFLDPYKPIVQVPHGFWLGTDPPIWTNEYHPANNMGFWTEMNNPHQP